MLVWAVSQGPCGWDHENVLSAPIRDDHVNQTEAFRPDQDRYRCAGFDRVLRKGYSDYGSYASRMFIHNESIGSSVSYIHQQDLVQFRGHF